MTPTVAACEGPRFPRKSDSRAWTALPTITLCKTVVFLSILLTRQLAAQADPSPDLHILQQRLTQAKPMTWVFTGDSVTQGAKWVQGARPYPEIVEERLRWEMSRRRDIIVNTAISSNKTDDILSDFDWRIGHLHPDVVSLMIGMNDSLRGPDGERLFRENLIKLVARIRSLDAIPILQTTNATQPDPARSDLRAYNAIIAEVAQDQKTILVDNWTYWTGQQDAHNIGSWLGQAIHPNGFGHAAIASRFFHTLGIYDPDSVMCTLPTGDKD